MDFFFFFNYIKPKICIVAVVRDHTVPPCDVSFHFYISASYGNVIMIHVLTGTVICNPPPRNES